MTPEEIKQLRDYYRDLNLSTDQIEQNLKTAAANQRYLTDQLEVASKYAADFNDGFTSLSKTLTSVVRDLNKSSTASRDINKSFNKIDSLVKQLKYDQQGISELNLKDLKNSKSKLNIEVERLKNLKKELEEKKNLNEDEIAKLNELNGLFDKQGKLNNDIGNYLKQILKATDERIDQEKRIQAQLGLTGALVDGIVGSLGKLGINSVFFSDLKDDLRDAAKSGGALKVVFTAIGGLAKGLVQGLTDPLTILTFLLNAGLKADRQVTALAKSLVVTKSEATGIREQFVTASKAINDAFVTTDKLLESQTKLSDQLGITKIFSMDLNKEFTTLTGKIGLSEEAAGGLAKISIATGKSARLITTSTIGTIEKVKQETGLRLNNQKILEATGKVSGQLLANFRANPAAIAEAIAKTQALGTTLEQAKVQGESLLNFESSIENELKAELITGKQINLERARMAALMGDQKTVAEELSAQAVDFNTFSNMNVIAQKSLAEALGTSADALSDQLFKQQYLNKSREEIVALGGEEAAQRMEQLTAQDKFNAAIQKLQDILGNLVAGPLGQLVDAFASVASSATAIKIAMGALLGMSITKLVTGLASLVIPLVTGAAASATMMSALTLGVGAVAIIASIAGISSAMENAKKQAAQEPPKFAAGGIITSEINNATIGEAGPEAIIPLNSPKAANILGGNSDMGVVVSAINNLSSKVEALMSRPSVAYINGKDAFSKEVATTSVQNTYKLA